MQTANEIGNKIAVARKLKNLSQAELAAQMAVTPQAAGKWECGESMPDILAFERLAAVLDVDFNYFSEDGSIAPSMETAAKPASGANRARAARQAWRSSS